MVHRISIGPLFIAIHYILGIGRLRVLAKEDDIIASAQYSRTSSSHRTQRRNLRPMNRYENSQTVEQHDPISPRHEINIGNRSHRLLQGQDKCNPNKQICSQKPSSSPSFSGVPTFLPTVQPSEQISGKPSVAISGEPTIFASINPSEFPSEYPSAEPSSEPSLAPSVAESKIPTITPSHLPSIAPSTNPSSIPSFYPSVADSEIPTITPSKLPSISPTTKPSSIPSFTPSVAESEIPTITPSKLSSSLPSAIPTDSPSLKPSATESDPPTNTPSKFASTFPSSFPSESLNPSVVASTSPSNLFSTSPTQFPTKTTKLPSVFPSATSYSNTPSIDATAAPVYTTLNPTYVPLPKEYTIPLPQFSLNITIEDEDPLLIDTVDLKNRTQIFLSDFVDSACCSDNEYKFKSPIELITTSFTLRQRRFLQFTATNKNYFSVTFDGTAIFLDQPHPTSSSVEDWVVACFTGTSNIDFVSYLQQSEDKALSSASSSIATILIDGNADDNIMEDDIWSESNDEGGNSDSLVTIVGISAGSTIALLVFGLLMLRRKASQRKSNKRKEFVELSEETGIEVEIPLDLSMRATSAPDIFSISHNSLIGLASVDESRSNTYDNELSYNYSLGEIGSKMTNQSGIPSSQGTPTSIRLFEQAWRGDQSIVSFDQSSIPFDEKVDIQNAVNNDDESESSQDLFDSNDAPLKIVHSGSMGCSVEESVSDVSDQSSPDEEQIEFHKVEDGDGLIIIPQFSTSGENRQLAFRANLDSDESYNLI